MRSTSPSATPSPKPAPTWPRCARGPCATATSTSINGAKIFTSGADKADYIWLAVRTDPDAPKHKGISILCVPTDLARVLLDPDRHPVGGADDHRHLLRRRPGARSANRVGAENEGWRMITTQLNHERVGLAAWSGFVLSVFDEVVRWAARQPTDDGRTVIEQPWVQIDLARCHAELEAMYLLNWRMAAAVGRRRARARRTRRRSRSSAPSAPSRSTAASLGIVGAAGYLTPGSPGAVLRGRLERTGRQAQINTFGGGVNEVQREIVAMAGLGMTRGAR